MLTELALRSSNWQTEAACRDTDPDTMQPEVASQEDIERAKAVCGPCPVYRLCRELAESQLGAYGVHDGEWFGPPPAPVLFCQWCRGALASSRSTRSYCNDTCRKRASRAAAAA